LIIWIWLLHITNNIDLLFVFIKIKNFKKLINIFNKKQKKSITKDSLADKSKTSENKVYFNLKEMLLDLRQKKKKLTLKKS
jgi:hypothetical protein